MSHPVPQVTLLLHDATPCMPTNWPIQLPSICSRTSTISMIRNEGLLPEFKHPGSTAVAGQHPNAAKRKAHAINVYVLIACNSLTSQTALLANA